MTCYTLANAVHTDRAYDEIQPFIAIALNYDAVSLSRHRDTEMYGMDTFINQGNEPGSVSNPMPILHLFYTLKLVK